MTEPVLRLESLQKSYGGLRVTDDVTLDILPGEMHAIIGPNGAGKTTLINQISGIIPTDAGSIVFRGQDITRMPIHGRARLGIARSFQITSVLPGFTALENVALAVQARTARTGGLLSEASSDRILNEPAYAVLSDVGLASRANIRASHLSHGEKRVLELAMALAVEPKLLLLDEPMAGTGHDETARLIAALNRIKGRFSIILVEHDMQAVFALADRISVLIYGRVLVTGSPHELRTNPEVIKAYLGEEVE
ncbi:MAG: ABC transporter ATP-binding protein [Xanthobacteraceae bacterium]